MSNAFSGVGTQFKRASEESSGSGFVAVAEVNSISGPTMTREFIDVTSLDSTGGFREFITGFRDGGEVTLNMNFTYTTYNTLLGDFNDDDDRMYQIVLPDSGNTTFQFWGRVTQMPVDIPADDKVTADITVKITGQVTLSTS